MPSICEAMLLTICLGAQPAQTQIFDESQIQPDGVDDFPDNDCGDEMGEGSHEHSSAAPQPTSVMEDTDANNETASSSAEDKDLTGPSDSEDEDPSDLTQQLKSLQITQSSYAGHLPLRLQGLSITEIAKSEWLAESFLIGECANGIWRICM